jgi:murein DD-endopeptidase MepM/ murein hydrolase activator NlpD
MKKRKNKLIKWFAKKFQLILYHGKSFDVIWKFRFNRFGFTSILLASIALFFYTSYLIVAYTPLKETLPDFPTKETKILIYENAIRTDSLMAELDKRDSYLKMIQDLILNEMPIDEEYLFSIQDLTDEQIKDFNNPLRNGKKQRETSATSSVRSKELPSALDFKLKDSMQLTEKKKEVEDTSKRRKKQEANPTKPIAQKETKPKEPAKPTDNKNKESDKTFKNQIEIIQYLVSSKETIPVLFPPVKGIVVASFDKAKNHYGTDIASSGETTISSVLSGTVLVSDYTLQNGYTIIIQHKHDLVSVYKHNKSVLVCQGQHVGIGQAIAVYGNTGEYTSGEHLHFELWKKGIPLNPEDYIDFK